jgi:hypothetical protein
VSFLTAAIPGLREIRAPLVAGYIWLIFVWVLVDPTLPITEHTTGTLHSLAELAETAGKVATAAAVSVGAYLIGTLSASVTGGLGSFALSFRKVVPIRHLPATTRQWHVDIERQGASNPLQVPRGEHPDFGVATRMLRQDKGNGTPASLASIAQENAEVRQSLLSWLRVSLPPVRGADQLREKLSESWDQLNAQQLEELLDHVDRAQVRYSEELLLPATLVVGDNPLAFSETDRLRAEGEFALAAALPLMAVIGLLSFTESLSWWLALVLPVLIAMLGRTALQRSQDLVRQTLEYGQAPSPAIDELAWHVDRLRASR